MRLIEQLDKARQALRKDVRLWPLSANRFAGPFGKSFRKDKRLPFAPAQRKSGQALFLARFPKKNYRSNFFRGRLSLSKTMKEKYSSGFFFQCRLEKWLFANCSASAPKAKKSAQRSFVSSFPDKQIGPPKKALCMRYAPFRRRPS